ncbi:hypothetical protein L2D04_21035 (plasmid) [Pantoea agglomerans]|uniref:hypothetical protein n=1 Tax=Enterobacter agglomerans TaxID=549 RepID=UPI001F15C9F7|nr:hypothetical protein [Pantoea agglomerans]UJQ25515.1 hypothetical protein L2D04_21035 [Pantoea agglomerans]
MLRLKALTKHLHLPLQQQMLRFMNLRGMVKTELLIPVIIIDIIFYERRQHISAD